MMKEKPILFNGEMVNAILEDRKTHTRRIVKFPKDLPYSNDEYVRLHPHMSEEAPVVKAGDQLWVRETWRTRNRFDPFSPKGIRDQYEDSGYTFNGSPIAPLKYNADGFERPWGEDDLCDFGDWGNTRVSIHMPRWASRIDLLIKGVKVERIQSISEQDAKAEGCDGEFWKDGTMLKSPYAQFRDLWVYVYGQKSWDANPWIWVYEFERITP